MTSDNTPNPEPGYFRQIAELFRGELGWISWLLMAAQLIMFAASVWMAIRFFAATDVLEALHWGLPAATLLIIATLTKLTLWPSLQANRVIREVKRLEALVERKG